MVFSGFVLVWYGDVRSFVFVRFVRLGKPLDVGNHWIRYVLCDTVTSALSNDNLSLEYLFVSLLHLCNHFYVELEGYGVMFDVMQFCIVSIIYFYF